MRVEWLASQVVLIWILTASASGQSTGSQTPPAESLSSKVVNPIAFLMRITAENKYSPSLWDSVGEENQAEADFVIPFEAFTRQNLARVKVIFETSNPDGTHGLSESEIFYLLLSERSWGTFRRRRYSAPHQPDVQPTRHNSSGSRCWRCDQAREVEVWVLQPEFH